MSRRLLCCTAFLMGLAACHGEDAPTPIAAAPAPSAPASPAAVSPRERLAMRLAVALNDPATRGALKRRLDASHAPEGKLQFQALARADQGFLLASLVRGGAATVAELLADLDAARPLEVYLPVEAHRSAWRGDAALLVATIGQDGEAPVAYDLQGRRQLLDANTPPSTPVLALVPQETDFTGGRPMLAAACFDLCADPGSSSGGGTSSGGTGTPSSGSATGGLYLTMSHFEDSFESWLKGKPEYEYHVYGLVAGSEAEQLACTGEHAGGASYFDQNGPDWNGSAMLLSEQDRQRYAAAHPGAPIRIVAYEDDDEPCVPRIDGNRVSQLLSTVDAAYRNLTSGKVEPWYVKGVRAAPSLFNLFSAVRNVITTGDDLIGNAVETSVAGWAPGGANWVLKSDGTRTYGWFATAYRP
jgi:hypothetical protein